MYLRSYYLRPYFFRFSLAFVLLIGLAACRPNHSPNHSNNASVASAPVPTEAPPASTEASVTKAATNDTPSETQIATAPKTALVFRGSMADQRAYVPDAITSASLKILENITPEKAETQFRELAQTGHQIIFVTDPIFSQATLKVAQEFPQTRFEQADAYRGAANVSTYSARTYEAAYLAGVIAAGSSKSFRIGVIADTPSAEHIRNINAFALGAQSQLTQIRVRVAWGKSAPAIKTALNTLLSEHVDVILPMTAQKQIAELSAKHPVATISWLAQAPANQTNPPLAEVSINWMPYLTDRIKAHAENRWEAHQIWWGAPESIISVSRLSPKVPTQIVQRVNSQLSDLQSGKLHPFAGPIIDKKGVHLANKGAVVSDTILKSMSNYVSSVRGHPPTN